MYQQFLIFMALVLLMVMLTLNHRIRRGDEFDPDTYVALITQILVIVAGATNSESIEMKKKDKGKNESEAENDSADD